MAGLPEFNYSEHLFESSTFSYDFDVDRDFAREWDKINRDIEGERKLWNSPSVLQPDSHEIRTAFNFADPFRRGNYSDEPQGLQSPLLPLSSQSPRYPNPIGPPKLQASDFFAYTQESRQFVHQECKFMIQLLSHTLMSRRSPMTTFPKSFKAMYFDPSGFEHSAQIVSVNLVTNTFQGSFYPPVPGTYTVSVFHTKGAGCYAASTENFMIANSANAALSNDATSRRNHVKGSPFYIKVSRNYGMEIDRVLLRISLCGLTDSGVNSSRCWGLATDGRTDNFFITNREKHDVSVFSSYGKYLFKMGQDVHNFVPGHPRENLFRPTGIVCDSFNRRLLVADKDNHRIAIYSLDGGFITSFGRQGHGNGEMSFPWDVDCSSTGDRIIVSDSRNHRIQTFDRFGNYVSQFSVFDRNAYEYKSILDNPRGITFDSEDNSIYVTDFTQESVTQISADLTKATKLKCDKSFSRLQGLTCDNVGNVLVCDTRRNLVRVIDPEGQVLSSIGVLGDGVLQQPLDVIIMRGGNVAVLDYDGRVRVF